MKMGCRLAHRRGQIGRAVLSRKAYSTTEFQFWQISRGAVRFYLAAICGKLKPVAARSARALREFGRQGKAIFVSFVAGFEPDCVTAVIERQTGENTKAKPMATILVVDDNAVIRRITSVALRRAGHTPVAAESAAEALALLEETPVELALLDLAMPDVDGLTLLRQLRADPRFQRLPIIMLTASAHDEDRMIARAAGANDFLTKPASSAELLATVNRWLPRAAAGTAAA